MCSSALYDTRSRPVGVWLGWIFSMLLMSSSSTTRPDCAPRCSSSAVDMLVSALRFTFQPELAEVFTTCSSWLDTLFNSSCGPSRFSTSPRVRPRRKYGKYGTTVKCLYGLQSSCRTTLSAMTVQRMRWISFFVVASWGLPARCWAMRSSSQSPGTWRVSPVSRSTKWSTLSSFFHWRSMTRMLRTLLYSCWVTVLSGQPMARAVPKRSRLMSIES